MKEFFKKILEAISSYCKSKEITAQLIRDMQEESRKSDEALLNRMGEMQTQMSDMRSEIGDLKNDFASLADDVGHLQGDRLNQMYNHLIDQGWCSYSEKMMVQDWYKSYTSKGRNHLAESYMEDVLSLPEHPEI